MARLVLLLCLATGPAAIQGQSLPKPPVAGAVPAPPGAVRIPRLRVIHSDDPRFQGTSLDLQLRDPWLAYEWGRQLTVRAFTDADGLGAPGRPARAARCTDCHGLEGLAPLVPGAQPFFGLGIVELLARQIERELLDRLDANDDGWVGLCESAGQEVFVPTAPGQPPLYFGRNADADGDGRPDLDRIFRITYVDAAGKVVPEALSIKHPDVAGYRAVVAPFGHGLDGTPTATLRAAALGAFALEMGLEAHDPTTNDDPDHEGVAGMSNAGSPQIPIPSPDPGRLETARGLSLDDPDGDGVIHEVSEGDLDLLEWFLLNSPRPARGAETSEARRGQRLLKRMGCTGCHTPNWVIRQPQVDLAKDPNPRPADRRFFDLQVEERLTSHRLEGIMRLLNRGALPDSFEVAGLYTDLRVHDLGPDYAPGRDANPVRCMFRTAPLWTAGTSAPYGFDGESPTLDAAIRRHGGEAAPAVERYGRATERERALLIGWLESLVTYETTTLAADIDGDFVVASPVTIAEQILPVETFWPELLFTIPCQFPEISEPLAPPPPPQNLRRAYGLGLSFLRDTDRDGFPDAVDPTWKQPGWRDGEER